MVAIKLKEVNCERRLEIVLYCNNSKSYYEISKIIWCSKPAAPDICKKFEETRSVNNFPRSERSNTIAIPRAERSVIN